jgi:hypothetical protein
MLSNLIGHYNEQHAYEKSDPIQVGKVRSFTAQIFSNPKLSSVMYPGLVDANIQSAKDYSVSIEYRSRRNDRDYGANTEKSRYSLRTPDFTTLSIDDKADWLITNLADSVNRQSRLYKSSNHRGTKKHVVFAINSAGGDGTPIGALQVGDTIPYIKNSNGVTLSVIVDKPCLILCLKQ